MKAISLNQIADIKLTELPMPDIKENEVMVKVKCCGVCGSDIPRVFSKDGRTVSILNYLGR